MKEEFHIYTAFRVHHSWKHLMKVNRFSIILTITTCGATEYELTQKVLKNYEQHK